MSTSLPIPSKGALRALRHLAVGTSCTVAFTAGLLSEDRRRRIHTARAVQENGRRIKGSKSYHGSAAAVAIATLEEQVLNHPAPHCFVEDASAASIAAWNVDTPSSDYVPYQSQQYTARVSAPKSEKNSSEHTRSRTTTDGKPHGGSLSGDYLSSRSSRNQVFKGDLATEIIQALKTDDSRVGIETATAIFLNCLRHGLQIGNVPGRVDVQLTKRLVNASGQIFDACQKHGCIGSYIPVLQKLLSLDPVEESVYYELHAPEAIAYILKRSKSRKHTEDKEYIDTLKTASNIYVAKFCQQPAMANQQMGDLAKLLCAETCKVELYDLTLQICRRAMAIPNEEPHACVNFLILAEHGKGHHKEVIKRFRYSFVLTEPFKPDFYAIVNAALDSCLQLERLDRAEEVVCISAEMARSSGFLIRADWATKVLGKHWRSTRNISSTRALFDRLETFMDCIDIPHTLYSAIIQFCIEDGKDDLAHLYLDKHVMATGTGAPSLRTRGHLALSSAMKGDWEDVENRFSAMISSVSDKNIKLEISRVFTPVFKLFAKSHDVRETEQFIKKFINEYGVSINSYASNIMVDKYAEAKEIDSIAQWFEFVRPLGVKPDTTTFNAMLSGLRDEWGFFFHDLLRLCRDMQTTNAEPLDDFTVSILREAAIRETKGDRFAFIRFLNMIKSLRIAHKKDSLEFWESMREAMGKGSPLKAIRIFKAALRETNLHIPPRMLGLAVQAALETDMDGGVDTAVRLLEEGRRRGIEISAAMVRLLMYQLNGHTLSNDAIHRVLEDNTVLFAKQGLTIPMGVVTHVASILCQQNLHANALDVWKFYAAQNGLLRESVDISSLTVLLRIQIGLESTGGVAWVIETLCQNKILPNQKFTSMLREGYKDARQRVRGEHRSQRLCVDSVISDKDRDFHQLLQDSLNLILSRRRQHLKECKAAEGKLMDIMVEAVKANGEDSKATIDSDSDLESSSWGTEHDTAEMDIGRERENVNVEWIDEEVSMTKSNLGASIVKERQHQEIPERKVDAKIPPYAFIHVNGVRKDCLDDVDV